MKVIVFSAENCQKCEMLKMACPDADCYTINPDNQQAVLNFARIANIKSLPFLVVVGETDDLEKVLKLGESNGSKID